MPASDQARWFAQEIQPHEAALRAYLRSRFPALHDIDDLVQETYVRLFRARETGRCGLTRAYLFVVARNVALDVFRRRKVAAVETTVEIARLSIVEEEPNAAEAASREQEYALLAEAIELLPSRCRIVLVLRRYHGLSHAEIAARLGIAENTVNAQLVAGMVRCRAYLRARGVVKGARTP